jgi:micrococcal nuclease
MIAHAKKLPNFTYAAEWVKVIDGDTIDVTVDLGFHVFREIRIRLLGVNTPELKGETKQAGEAARSATEAWLMNHDNLVISTWKVQKRMQDHFGRYLAIVRGDSPKGVQDTLNTYLIDCKLANRYMDEGLGEDFDIPE